MTVRRLLVRSLATAAFSTLAFAQPAPALVSDAAQQQPREVASWLAGSFSNHAQAAQDPAFFEVVLHMREIWPQRSGEQWLYVEQALAASPSQPYRQRVYRIGWDGRGPVSEVFTLPGDAAAFVGAWRNVAVFEALSPQDLHRREGCSLHLVKQPDGTYRGSTVGHDCASERSGAAYATAEVMLDANVLTSWDRGFGVQGKQVWGSERGPYRFERQPPG